MMYAQIRLVLIMGSMLLAFGSVSMLMMRRFSPGLQGVAWFSAAFASGSLGFCLLLHDEIPFLPMLAHMCLLGAFVFQHVAVLKVARAEVVPIWRGVCLMAAQALMDVLNGVGWLGERPHATLFSLVLAVQTATTAIALWKLAQGKLRAPAVYSAGLLVGFGGLNLLRSVLVATGGGLAAWVPLLACLALMSYVGMSLGLAFGFIWMTTASLAEEIEHTASLDPLTRIYNRRVFLELCEKEFLRSQRSELPFSLLIMDLDHFKYVNDSFGHQRGDEVLCAAVERMQDAIRGIDVLCRWGGEEFAVLLPNASSDATRMIAERIRASVQKILLPARGTASGSSPDFNLTVSIGTVTFRNVQDSIGTLLERADHALYEAKRAGRNRVLEAA